MTQLGLFDVIGGGDVVPAHDLAKGIPAGAESLLAELVKRGLSEGDVRVASALCLLLDEGSRGNAL